MPPHSPSNKFPALSFLLPLLLVLSAAVLLLSPNPFSSPAITPTSTSTATPGGATTVDHILFGIASSPATFPRRHPYILLWHRPNLTHAHLFLPALPAPPIPPSLPPLHLTPSASHLPYTFPSGAPSAVRIARILLSLLPLARPHTRWLVLADDDTLFFPQNLADTLAKYDANQWWYVGGRSESVDQNGKHSFGMAYGGGGIAISLPLARVLGKVLDGCLVRYGHLYGSDDRVYACLAELGVELTYEPGFHQVDLRGDLFGLLSAHPLTPPISLHHLDSVDPLFPGMNRLTALKHLYKAVNIDTSRVLQQIVCYDRTKTRTISVSWGYAVQVFEGNHLLPDILSLQQSFSPWKRSRNSSSRFYMFNTREFPRDPCKRPAVFFLESVFSDKSGIKSNYSRHVSGNCISKPSTIMRQIRVYSQKLHREIGQVQRRECCNVLPSSSETFLEINVRKCKETELIAMHQ